MANRLMTFGQARFSSQFDKLSRTLEVFEPANYTLPRTEQKLLVEQPWTQRPFVASKDLKMPIYEFITGKFSYEVVTLD